jgi:hypothetical protein
MTDCSIPVEEIFSRSLKRLSIEGCFFDNVSRRPCISLQLTDTAGGTPFLQDMPALVTAMVRFTPDFWDTRDEKSVLMKCGDASCECCYSNIADEPPNYCYDASCECCYGYDDSKDGCVFLKGLSAAKELKLIAGPELVLLRLLLSLLILLSLFCHPLKFCKFTHKWVASIILYQYVTSWDLGVYTIHTKKFMKFMYIVKLLHKKIANCT